MEKMYGFIQDDAPLTLEERNTRAQAYIDKVAERRARRAAREKKRRARRMETLNNILHRVFFVLAIILALLVCTGYAGGVI